MKYNKKQRMIRKQHAIFLLLLLATGRARKDAEKVADEILVSGYQFDNNPSAGKNYEKQQEFFEENLIRF